MSSISPAERRRLEKLFEMSGGYVLDFTDTTFDEFMGECAGVDIHSRRYSAKGTSKAKKLRTFWTLEDDRLVGRCILALVAHWEQTHTGVTDKQSTLIRACRSIASRLLSGTTSLDSLRHVASELKAPHLADQIRRVEDGVDRDPAAAVGAAKELVETVCRTILDERKEPDPGNVEFPKLVRATLKVLKLLPDEVPNAAKGAETIKRLLSNLATMSQGLAELRNLYGTRHGRHGRTKGISPRHARLAVGAAATLARFLYDTHVERDK